MATLEVIDGRPAVVIEGAHGTGSYLFEVLPPPCTGVLWMMRLTRIEDATRTYTVTAWKGRVICDCKDWQYRPSVRETGCKHCRAARAVRTLLAALRNDP